MPGVPSELSTRVLSRSARELRVRGPCVARFCHSGNPAHSTLLLRSLSDSKSLVSHTSPAAILRPGASFPPSPFPSFRAKTRIRQERPWRTPPCRAAPILCALPSQPLLTPSLWPVLGRRRGFPWGVGRSGFLRTLGKCQLLSCSICSWACARKNTEGKGRCRCAGRRTSGVTPCMCRPRVLHRDVGASRPLAESSQLRGGRGGCQGRAEQKPVGLVVVPAVAGLGPGKRGRAKTPSDPDSCQRLRLVTQQA